MVCPGPIWTPLVVATMTKESLEAFGPSTAIGRAGQPVEVATAFVFLASADSSYFTAQVCYFFALFLIYGVNRDPPRSRIAIRRWEKARGKAVMFTNSRAAMPSLGVPEGAVRRTEDRSYKGLVGLGVRRKYRILDLLEGSMGQMTSAASYFDLALTGSAST